MITVNDIRRAIQDLPDESPVLIKPVRPEEWGYNEKSIRECSGAHDGRFGTVLLLVLGGYVSPWQAHSRETEDGTEGDKESVVSDEASGEEAITARAYMG